jgi:hypothetical protein
MSTTTLGPVEEPREVWLMRVEARSRAGGSDSSGGNP